MPNHLTQWFFITSEAGHHRHEHGIGLEPLKSERMSGVCRQDIKESQLGTAIAITERMDGIEFGEEGHDFHDKGVPGKPVQKPP